MPTRAHVGRAEGVTIASMSPDTSRTTTRPSATATTARPCSASASVRFLGPGSMAVQPRRMPTAAARKTAVSSSRPCGVIRPKKTSSRSREAISPAETPTFAAFCQRMYGIGMPSSTEVAITCIETQALLIHTCPANAPAGCSE